MKINKTKILTPLQEEQIDRLWDQEYPVKLGGRFRLLLDGVKNYNHYLVEDDAGNVLAWAVDFEKDNETRFSVIVDTAQKGKGLGSLLVRKLQDEIEEFYGWVIDHNGDKKSNGEYYQTPLPFYVNLGFEVLHDKRIESEMLQAVKVKWYSKK